ncbi:MAG TPA: menaquinone reductase multiheme cytochrome c subunit QrcA [Desulfatiglandales bacterium]|nr:menaquinone reductase multiheme cytochrome c subunit QrcA [Desulfatiglandales bacterium]
MEADSKQTKKTGKGGWIFFLAGLAASLVVGWIVFPALLYSTKNQPLNFSHPSHGVESSVGLDCEECHLFYEDGSFSGIPGIQKCMECHEDPESPYTESPEEKKLLTDYVGQSKEIPWLSYSHQPDCVYFPHIAHVKMAEIECRTCHGDFATQKTPPVYKINRLSRYSIDIWGRNIAGLKKNTWDRMKMDDCAECHTKKGKEDNNACFVCHK